jgi:hypothetical protein
LDDGILSRILYADDVVVGPKTGKVYFTDGKIDIHGLWAPLYFSVS